MKLDEKLLRTMMKLPTCPYCSRQIAQDITENTITYDDDYVRWRCLCGKDFYTTTVMRFVTDWTQKE